jgi:NADH dehydrogenase
MTQQPQRKPHVIIVGGGFGGVRAARRLARRGFVTVTLISSDSAFAYYPQLYHAATGGSRSESALPLGDLLDGTGVEFVQDTVTTLDTAAHTVTGASGRAYHYNDLILALGSVTNYFGIKGLEEFAYNIKSITGAERFKRHLHDQLIQHHQTDLNYVVVGGGPTGVELAAALGGYLHRITRLHGLKRPKYHIDLIEAAPRLVPRSPEAYSRRVQRQLQRLGVKVMTGAVVQAESATQLKLKGETLKTQTVVWTAGVANNPFYAANAAAFTLAKNGKVQVNEYLEAAPHVYVIGDNAATPFSGMAQTAIYDADFVARDIWYNRTGRQRPAYLPKAPITVLPVGERWAAVQWGSVRLYGFIGFVLRRAADLIAYADIESWPKAWRVWLADSRHEDNCRVCAAAEASEQLAEAKN